MDGGGDAGSGRCPNAPLAGGVARGEPRWKAPHKILEPPSDLSTLPRIASGPAGRQLGAVCVTGNQRENSNTKNILLCPRDLLMLV